MAPVNEQQLAQRFSIALLEHINSLLGGALTSYGVKHKGAFSNVPILLPILSPGVIANTYTLPFPLSSSIAMNEAPQNQEFIMPSKIKSNFEFGVMSSFKRLGIENMMMNPILVEFQSSNNLLELFDTGSEDDKHEDFARLNEPGMLINQLLCYSHAALTPVSIITNLRHLFMLQLPLEEVVMGRLVDGYSQCEIVFVELSHCPIGLVLSATLFKTMLDYRERLITLDENLINRIKGFNQIGRNLSLTSFIWTYGMMFVDPEKKQRDITRYKVTKEMILRLLFKGRCLRRNEYFGIVYKCLSKAIKEYEKSYCVDFVNGILADVKPKVLDSSVFIIKEMIKGFDCYSDLATTLRVNIAGDQSDKILKFLAR